MLETFKFGIPQLLEVAFLVWAVCQSIIRHGQPVITKKTRKDILIDGDAKTQNFAHLFMKTVNIGQFVFWVVIAWWGGLSGKWLLTYTIATAIMIAFVNNLSLEKIMAMKYSAYRTIATQAVFQIILYLGGFYTI